METMEYCLYYQAYVKRELCWFLVGILRSYEHMAFDRTIDKEKSIFEFFVPVGMQKQFEVVMDAFLSMGVITSCSQLENRLKNSNQEV